MKDDASFPTPPVAQPPPEPPPGSILADITTPFDLSDDFDFTQSDSDYPSLATLPPEHNFEDIELPSIHRISCSSVVCGLSSTGPRFVARLMDGSTHGLVDSGANLCMTNNPSLLLDIRQCHPFHIDQATSDGSPSKSNVCNQVGMIPIPLLDGTVYHQMVFVNPHAAGTFLSPQAIIDGSNNKFTRWIQEGNTHGQSGALRIYFTDGSLALSWDLTQSHGLYFCSMTSLALSSTPASLPRTVSTPDLNTPIRATVDSARTRPVTSAQQLESELWAARLGFCGEHQLMTIPLHATGIPKLQCHPLRFIDWKEEAHIRRQPAGGPELELEEAGARFHMDFGFMRASTGDLLHPSTQSDRVVESYDGFSSYLLIVDAAKKMAWVFCTKSKEPPLELISLFLTTYGRPFEKGGFVRCDQGGELARSSLFVDLLLNKFNYRVEPTGADSPSQNGGAERWNQTFAVTVRALLYGSGLHAKYWSAALRHAVYLHNRRVHSHTGITPYEGWWGEQPDLRHLRAFGARVCVRKTGSRAAKLDKHSFRGIFIGYSATDNNVLYLDLDSGIVKTSHHVVFDEAWYLQPNRPPMAQFLYDLGLCQEDSPTPSPLRQPQPEAPWPPSPPDKWIPCSTSDARRLTLPFGIFPCRTDNIISRVYPSGGDTTLGVSTIYSDYSAVAATLAGDVTTISDVAIAQEYDIRSTTTSQVYMSPDPFNAAFEEQMDIRRLDCSKHRSGGMLFVTHNGRIYLGGMAPSSPGSRIPRWISRLRGACLLSIDGTRVSSVAEVHAIFAKFEQNRAKVCTLLFAHPEIKHGLSNKGLPMLSRDILTTPDAAQLNNRKSLVSRPPQHVSCSYVSSGNVLNMVTRVMKLTRGKLMRQDDWDAWHQAEFLQLDQYEKQNMFGTPCLPPSQSAIFNLVWNYVRKVEDGRYKARMTCDGSSRAGQVRILDETFASCVDRTGSRLFYAIAAAENLLVYGSDVSNAFGEAAPPKQGFYIRPDQAFKEWWTEHKGYPPIPDGYVIPVLAAMQGHPESPRLWEKHIDKILRSIGLKPTTHEPCLYSGTFLGQRVLLMRQVDDFAVAAPTSKLADHLFDLIDDHLSIPLKRQGLVSLYNGLDVLQTRQYIKISCQTFIERACDIHLTQGWMKDYHISDRPLPLPSSHQFLRDFLGSCGSSDPEEYRKLEKSAGLSYRQGVGQLSYAMTCCRPDLSYTTVKLAQVSAAPAKCHFDGLRHALKYLYQTRSDGLYFWRSSPRNEIEDIPPPRIMSANMGDLLPEGRPQHEALTIFGFSDADWAACPKTRRSLTGVCVKLAGATIAYKTRMQRTIATSSTESELMAAYDLGKIMLYIRSVLWDLDVPQEAATHIYEDNDACTIIANAQKVSDRTRHMDIKYKVLGEWIDRDLLTMSRVGTTVNEADHFTKSLNRILFHRHLDYIMGHVPPQYAPGYNRALGLFDGNGSSAIASFIVRDDRILYDVGEVSSLCFSPDISSSQHTSHPWWSLVSGSA